MLPNSRLARRPSNEKQISKIKKEFFQGTQGHKSNFSKHLCVDLESEIDRLFGDVKRSSIEETPTRPLESNMKHRPLKALSPNCITPQFEDDKIGNAESTNQLIRQGTVREYLTYLSKRTLILEHLSKKRALRKRSASLK